MDNAITYKELTSLDEIALIQHLEKLVWNMEPIPIHQTLTAVKNGGIIVGAFKGNELIGYNYSFTGFDNKSPYLCSHMMGIHPDYRGKGIGDKLKRLQREIAIKKGYSLITWTYDPLENINAYLNLHKLRGIAAEYLENNYGSMSDSLNYGLPTDRFKIDWRIIAEHVNDFEETTASVQLNRSRLLLIPETNSNGYPYLKDTDNLHLISQHQGENLPFFVPIPKGFQLMKRDDLNLAIDWRLKTREAFKLLLENGYVGTDVIRTSAGATDYYVFEKKADLKL